MIGENRYEIDAQEHCPTRFKTSMGDNDIPEPEEPESQIMEMAPVPAPV
jgi:hypothetical protein